MPRFDRGLRLRRKGALCRPPPEDLHHAARAADAGAYYHCDVCRTGVCPRDRTLGMHATSLSPGVLRLVGLAASDSSFAAASNLLWELAAVRVETKQVERCAEALGRAVAADERAVAETVPSPAPTMYLGLDGSGVPVRPTRAWQAAGRFGQDPRGWPPCGRPKGATHKAGPCATAGRSPTPRSRARPAATPTHSRPPSPNVSIARRNGAASTPRTAGSSSDGAAWMVARGSV